jgi:hypothetical protein
VLMLTYLLTSTIYTLNRTAARETYKGWAL